LNRSIITGEQPIGPSDLPPGRQRGETGPVRVLFIGSRVLGFKTVGQLLENATADRADIDAVHWYPQYNLLERVLSAPTPLTRWGLDFRARRAMHSLSRSVRRRLGKDGDLPSDRFDVVFFHTQQLGSCIPSLVGRVPFRTVVACDATMKLYQQWFGDSPRGAGGAIGHERLILHGADAVAGWSNWVLNSVRDDYDVSPAKLFLFRPCPIRATSVEPAQRNYSGKLRILFAGNDWERKGGPRLIRWHQERWIGKAEVHVCSAKAPQDHSLRDVVWHGATPHKKLLEEILPTMHVLAAPTSVDTFVIAVAEAQIAGVPVVTSRLSGIQELVKDGVTGFLCDRTVDQEFIAGVDQLVASEALRREMAIAAHAHASRNLNSRTWTDHLLDQFKHLASGRQIERAPAGTDDARMAEGQTDSDSSAS
jgi:glycosyltransferase involved in cell wall biosynthesis